MDIIWGDKTFLFTAITGCAAALFGGVTLHSAAYLNSRSKIVTPDMMHTWDQVRMLIIDEISFSTNDHMERLNHVSITLEENSVLERKYCHQI